MKNENAYGKGITVTGTKDGLRELGSKIKEIRQILGFTQEEMARRVNITQVNIARVESGSGISAHLLVKVLAFCSQYVSIDVLFDEKAWAIACQDREMLLKKTHINSIIHAKLTLMKKHLLDELRHNRELQTTRDNEFEGYIRRGMDSAISMLDEDEI